MPESTRRSTLNQELIRRMVNTSEKVPMSKRLEIVDKYAQKMINSEYSLDMTRQTIVGGLKGYERLLSLSKDLSNPKWKPLHLAAKWNPRNRRIAKQLAKTNWYKEKSEVEPPPSSQQEELNCRFSIHKDGKGPAEKPELVQDDQKQDADSSEEFQKVGQQDQVDGKARQGKNKKRGSNRRTITLGGLKKVEKAKKRKERQKVRKKLGKVGVHEGRKPGKKAGKPPPTKSVLFLDNTGGELARRFQAAEEEAGRVTGYKIRITESAGTPLSMVFSSTNPWGSQECGRHDCVPCQQQDKVRINCRKRNILYESECEICDKERKGKDGKSAKDFQLDGQGVYVGESSRSLYERSKEHVADRIGGKEDSHQLKHWITSHPNLEEPPRFIFKIVNSFKDPLTRQLSEAIRIERRGCNILNSKAEYNRCRIPRLVMDPEVWNKKKTEMINPAEPQPTSSHQEENNPLIVEAEESLAEKESRKRSGDVPEGRKTKRRKYCLLEGWGEDSSTEEELHHHHFQESNSRKDWLEEKEEQKEESKKMNQTRISSWLGGKKPEKIVNFPEEQIKTTTPARNNKGKLTKKEQEKMKKCHPNIREMIRSNSNLLTVTHTPLLGAHSSTYPDPDKLDVPRAGIKDACHHQCIENCVHKSPDMRKVRGVHGSPKLEITLSRSPMMINGKLEKFGELAEMIEYWEEQEEEEKDKEQRGPSQERRRSRRITELCGIYEGGMNSDQMNQPTVNGGGGGEGREPESKVNSTEGRNKIDGYVFQDFQEQVLHSESDIIPVAGNSVSSTLRTVNTGR